MTTALRSIHKYFVVNHHKLMVLAIKVSCISFRKLAHASRDCVVHVVRNPRFQTGALKQMDVFRIVPGAASPTILVFRIAPIEVLRSHLFRCIRRYAVIHQGLSIRVHFRVQRWEHLIVHHHGHASAHHLRIQQCSKFGL